MSQIAPTDGRLGPKHFAHHNADSFRAKLKDTEQQESARQALIRGENTPAALTYARFLNAVENDATLDKAGFRPFLHDDEEVARDWPHLFTAQKEETR
jgi:hypothetical protein